MNKIDWALTGGMPLEVEDFDYIFNQDGGVYDAINAYYSAFGSNYIISGCDVVGTAVSAGFVFINGKVYKVDAHTKTGDYFSVQITYPSEGRELFFNQLTNDTWVKERATLSATSGSLKYDGTRLSQVLTTKSAFADSNNIATLTLGSTNQSWVVAQTQLPSTFTRNNYILGITFAMQKGNAIAGRNSLIGVSKNGVFLEEKFVINYAGNANGLFPDITSNYPLTVSYNIPVLLQAGDIITVEVFTESGFPGATLYYLGYTIN